MPNLRKKSSVLTYNDDAIYRAMENQRKLSHVTKTVSRRFHVATNKDANFGITEDERKIPEFVYADDGRKFYPCLFCCHAFAIKELQTAHLQECTFRVTPETKPPPLKQISSKIRKIPKAKGPPVHRKRENGLPGRSINKSNPKLVVQKPKQLKPNSMIGNNINNIVKRLPGPPAVSNIKLEHGTEEETKLAKPSNINSQFINQKTKLMKLSNIVNHLHNPNVKTTNSRSRLLNQNKTIKSSSFKIKNKVSSCTRCNMVFESYAKLLQHKQEKHVFAKVYISEDQLKEYDDMYKNSDMSKCTLCFKPISKIRWGRHLQTHIAERKHCCSICKKSFARKDHRDVHEKKHIANIIASKACYTNM